MISTGDIVRVKNADQYVVAFANKVRDRDAVVLWVGPNIHGMFKDSAKVIFLKRNGHGKEFEQILYQRDLIVQTKQDE